MDQIITRVSSIFTMDHPDFIVCSFMEDSIGLKRANTFLRFILNTINNDIFFFPRLT